MNSRQNKRLDFIVADSQNLYPVCAHWKHNFNFDNKWLDEQYINQLRSCERIQSMLFHFFSIVWVCICWNNKISFLYDTFSRATFLDFRVLPLDLGAHYSSFIMGLATMAVSVGYILNPLAVGLIVTTHVSKIQFWNYQELHFSKDQVVSYVTPPSQNATEN